jgi:hypothetical protein
MTQALIDHSTVRATVQVYVDADDAKSCLDPG